MLRAILSTTKSFSDPWVGHRALNLAGLHPLRMLIADACQKVRARATPVPERWRATISTLHAEGVVAVNDVLAPDAFRAAQREAAAEIERTLRLFPPRENRAPKASRRKEFFEPGNYDLFDGGTLNRFLALAPERLPLTASFVGSDDIMGLYGSILHEETRPAMVQLQYLRHDRIDVVDPQKSLHRDTFHPVFKWWFFFDPVTPENGPFEYVIGSHKATMARLAWEYRRSLAETAKGGLTGGSFRIRPEELARLDLPQATPFCLPANSLLIANTRGFHRRGAARQGAVRTALHGGRRPNPFRLRPTRPASSRS